MSYTDLMEKTDLSLLALKAAMQIDAIRKGRQSDDQYVADFLEGLKDRAGSPGSPDAIKTLAPSTVSAFSRALGAYSGQEIETVNEAYEKYSELLAKLGSPLPVGDKDLLTRLFSFCVTLHKELLLSRRNKQTSRKPTSEYRVQWI